jgi:hypothetical protein
MQVADVQHAQPFEARRQTRHDNLVVRQRHVWQGQGAHDRCHGDLRGCAVDQRVVDTLEEGHALAYVTRAVSDNSPLVPWRYSPYSSSSSITS